MDRDGRSSRNRGQDRGLTRFYVSLSEQPGLTASALRLESSRVEESLDRIAVVPLDFDAASLDRPSAGASLFERLRVLRDVYVRGEPVDHDDGAAASLLAAELDDLSARLWLQLLARRIGRAGRERRAVACWRGNFPTLRARDLQKHGGSLPQAVPPRMRGFRRHPRRGLSGPRLRGVRTKESLMWSGACATIGIY